MSALTDRIATMILTGHTDAHIARTLNCHRATPNAVRHQLRRTGRYVTARLAAEAVPTGRTLRRQRTSAAEAAYHRAVLAAALTEPTQEDDDMDEPAFILSRSADRLDHIDYVRPLGRIQHLCPGVTMVTLEEDREQRPTSAVVWFEPGAEIPVDHHGDSAEVNRVVYGELWHAGVRVGPGQANDTLTCARGTTHSPSSPKDGPGALVHVTFPDRQPRR